MPQLSELLKQAKLTATIVGDATVQVHSITTDSRQVGPGTLFIAVPGATADGAAFIPAAVDAGACAVLAASDVMAQTHGVPLARVEDVRSAVASIAAAFYPRKPAHCYAVTGTDGKTSTAEFVRQLTVLIGRRSASIGTLGLRSGDAAFDAAFPALNTSPEPILLHRTLQQLAEAGITDVAMETSSHGLDQRRAAEVPFVAGAFTNLARDHLDYHQNIDAYFAAKARLFNELLPEGATAVINHDDPRFLELADIVEDCALRLTSFGTSAHADLRIVEVTPTVEGLEARLSMRGVSHTLSLPFYGAFQLMNMLAAMGLIEATGVDVNTLVPLLPQLTGVPGRLEKIAMHNGAPIFIDYAHTPAALENILRTLRRHTAKKLHVVFGCGGDRDAGKRPEMGRVAAELADHVVITDDNPRSENPATIRAAILLAAKGADEIPGRDVAIARAVQQLEPGDVLVIAGKGHETTQIIGAQTLHFNDAEEIRKAVAA